MPILTLLFSAAVSAAQTVPAAPMLAAHNEARHQHNLPPLSWSQSLAKNAGRWVDHLAKEDGCQMQHAKGTGQGENLFWASAATWSDGRREVQSVTPEIDLESAGLLDVRSPLLEVSEYTGKRPLTAGMRAEPWCSRGTQRQDYVTTCR